MAHSAAPPAVWLNSSTATIYKHSLDKPMDEAEARQAAARKLRWIKGGRTIWVDIRGDVVQNFGRQPGEVLAPAPTGAPEDQPPVK